MVAMAFSYVVLVMLENIRMIFLFLNIVLSIILLSIKRYWFIKVEEKNVIGDWRMFLM